MIEENVDVLEFSYRRGRGGGNRADIRHVSLDEPSAASRLSELARQVGTTVIDVDNNDRRPFSGKSATRCASDALRAPGNQND
jgi:hypothetical protein